MGPPDAEIAAMRDASKRRAARAAELVAQIRNRDLIWWVARSDDGSFRPWFSPRVTGGPAEDLTPRMPRGPAAELLNGYAFGVNRSDWLHFRSDEERPALFQALDDPERFAVAHYILSEVYRRGWERELEQRPDGTFRYTNDGLKVELRPDGEPQEGTTFEGIAAFQKCTARIDPAQLPAIRERWLQEWR
jgi:hypothetical protein